MRCRMPHGGEVPLRFADAVADEAHERRRLQRPDGAEQEMAVPDGEDFDLSALHSVDDAVVAVEDLADVVAPEFGHDAP